MEEIRNLEPSEVFRYFEEISQIPHGSENMEKITEYCLKFAEKHDLKSYSDEAGNVIIYKKGSAGFELCDPVILQGHLDMVCQKTEDSEVDFLRDGLSLYVEGDFLRAKGSTLGADNGIAVSMILAILASDTIEHPPIEAVFTTDEEIGMIGAGKLDMSKLSAKKMINLDAEEPDTLTVSCAGGSDFRLTFPIVRETLSGTKVTLLLKGLKGGHSGVEIHTGRVNANVLAGRVLLELKNETEFDLLSLGGGDKGNAITPYSKIEFLIKDFGKFSKELTEVLDEIKKEISDREPSFSWDITEDGAGEFSAFNKVSKENAMILLLLMPNGVQDMSVEIDGLVETSLNIGILRTDEDCLMAHYTLRSNKKTALFFLEEKLKSIATYHNWNYETFGHYPPWEFKEQSHLQKLYRDVYREKMGEETKVVAIHAGLECGVFSSGIEGLDCIAIGPLMEEVHTVNERLSISSTALMFDILKELLRRCK